MSYVDQYKAVRGTRGSGREEMTSKQINELLDKLAECLIEKHFPDRFGGYVATVFNRRKARKALLKAVRGKRGGTK